MDWESFILNTALTTLFAVIKNPAKVAKFSAALKKMRNVLNALPLGD